MNKTVENLYKTISCNSVAYIDYKYRCAFTSSVNECQKVANIFNYFEVMYCILKISCKKHEIAVATLFFLLGIWLMVFVAHIVEKYFAPILKILSLKMQMSEYLAGATLLTFGNSLSDLLANFMPIRHHAPLYTITISNAIAVMLMSGGAICFLRSFKFSGAYAVRDMLFLYLTILIGLYIVYLLINIFDLIIMRLTIKSLRMEIFQIRIQSVADEHNLIEKRKKLREFELDNKLVIYTNATYFDFSRRNTSIYSNSSLESRIHTANRKSMVDVQATRNSMYYSQHSRNTRLFQELFISLNPINEHQWKHSTISGRALAIITAPLALISSIFIPVVDYQLSKHGWSKLLNCTQIISSPFMLITMTHALIKSEYKYSHIAFDLTYGLISLSVTVPIAIFVFFNSRTDRPPKYHELFISITFCDSMMVIAMCATELETLFCHIGLALSLSEDFIATTVRASAVAVADMIMNVDLALHGYRRMALGAVFASPMFTICIGLALPCIFNKKVMEQGASIWFLGDQGFNCQLYFRLSILSTLMWALVYNFNARRLPGIFSFILYFMFILFAVFAEFGVIDLSDAVIYKPT